MAKGHGLLSPQSTPEELEEKEQPCRSRTTTKLEKISRSQDKDLRTNEVAVRTNPFSENMCSVCMSIWTSVCRYVSIWKYVCLNVSVCMCANVYIYDWESMYLVYICICLVWGMCLIVCVSNCAYGYLWVWEHESVCVYMQIWVSTAEYLMHKDGGAPVSHILHVQSHSKSRYQRESALGKDSGVCVSPV